MAVEYGLDSCLASPPHSPARCAFPRPRVQELRAEEDRIYAQWMAQAQEAAQAARAAYHARRRAQLLEVGWCLYFKLVGVVWCPFACVARPSPTVLPNRSQHLCMFYACMCLCRVRARLNSPYLQLLQEARAVVAERRGAALQQIAAAQQKEGVFGWPEGVPEAGECWVRLLSRHATAGNGLRACMDCLWEYLHECPSPAAAPPTHCAAPHHRCSRVPPRFPDGRHPAC